MLTRKASTVLALSLTLLGSCSFSTGLLASSRSIQRSHNIVDLTLQLATGVGCFVAAIAWKDPDTFAPVSDDAESWKSPADRQEVIDTGGKWVFPMCASTSLFAASGLYGAFVRNNREEEEQIAEVQAAQKSSNVSSYVNWVPPSPKLLSVEEILIQPIADVERYRLLSDRCKSFSAVDRKLACYHQARILIAEGADPRSWEVETLISTACEDLVVTPAACALKKRLAIQADEKLAIAAEQLQKQLAAKKAQARDVEARRESERVAQKIARAEANEQLFSGVPRPSKWFCRVIFIEEDGELVDATAPCYETKQRCEVDLQKQRSQKPVGKLKVSSKKCEPQTNAACFAYRNRLDGDIWFGCSDSFTICDRLRSDMKQSSEALDVTDECRSFP